MNDQYSGLIDIIDPSAPIPDAGSDLTWVWLALVVAMPLMICAVFWWRKKRISHRAVKHLHKLHQHFLSGNLTSHEAVFFVALALRHGLGLTRLYTDDIPPVFQKSDQILWPAFIHRLDVLRYQPGTALDGQEMETIFAQVEIWLRRYCR